MVIGIGVPRSIDLERPEGLAARCVAQVGRDTAVLVLEFLDRVERRPVRHEVDGRVLTPAGDDEQGEAGAVLLVVNADLALLVKRHGVLPFAPDYLGPNTSTATRPALTAQGQPA